MNAFGWCCYWMCMASAVAALGAVIYFKGWE